MGHVHDQVQEHLGQLAYVAGDGREIAQFHSRSATYLNSLRATTKVVFKASFRSAGASRRVLVAEGLHGADNRSHPVHAFQGLGDGGGDLDGQVEAGRGHTG